MLRRGIRAEVQAFFIELERLPPYRPGWAHLWVRTWLWHGGQCTRVRQQGTSENSRRLISMSTDIELDANHGVS